MEHQANHENKESEQRKPYAELARYLFDRIEELKPEDKEALRAYEEINDTLSSLLGEKLHSGLPYDMDLWIGLKLDTPSAGETYMKDKKSSYPEVFDVMENNSEEKSN